MELLWQEGHTVTHSLTNSPPTKPESAASSLREAEAEQEEEYHHLFSQGDETAILMSYPPWMNDGITNLAGDDDNAAAVLAVINNIGDGKDISSWLEKNRAPAGRDRQCGVGQGAPAGFWHRGADESMVVDPGASVDAARAFGAVAPVSSGDEEILPPPRKDRKRKHSESNDGGERDEVV